MKLSNLIKLILLSVILVAQGCQSPIRREHTPTDDSSINVKAYLYQDGLMHEELQALVNTTEGKVIVQVPYYMSEDEPIQGDLTRMKLRASLPFGAHFVPSLEGVHDLERGFSSTLHYSGGETKEFTFTAQYVKSSLAQLTKIILPDFPTLRYNIEDTGENQGKVKIVRTSSGMEKELRGVKVNMELSPWATSSIRSGEILDLTSPETKVRITSQDGKTIKEYSFELVNPRLKPLGEWGTRTPLFGKYMRRDDGNGWTAGNNRTMGVVGDELVVSNIKGALLRYDRYTGKKLDKSVNMNGTDLKNLLAICHDDGNHLVGIDMASKSNKWIPNRIMKIYVWKEGLDAPASTVYELDLTTAPEFAEIVSDAGIGRTIAVTGDILTGKAQVGLFLSGAQKAILYHFTDGICTGNTGFFTPAGEEKGFLNSTKVYPLNTKDDTEVLIGMTKDRKLLLLRQNGGFTEFAPASSWWESPGNTKTFSYKRFHGMEIAGIINGYLDGGIDAYSKMTVHDISSRAGNALTKGLIIDSRNINADPSVSGEMNYTPTGFLSLYTGASFPDNANRTGDVVIAENEDGTAIQVYILCTNQGIMGYEITAYDL